MSTTRYHVVKVREPRPYAVLDARHNRFVLDEDGALLLSATAEAAAVLASRIFNGESRSRIEVAR